MQRHVLIVASLLALQASIVAQQSATPEAASGQVSLVCPLDGFSFTWPAVKRLPSNVPYDSDFCRYAFGTFGPAEDVITCPHCNYTDIRMRFSTTTLDDRTKDKLRVALAASGYRGVQDSFLMIPAWERCRLGEMCAKARGLKASETVDFALLAVYSVRVQSTRSATLSLPFGDPLRNATYFASAERGMLETNDPGKRARLKLQLAMLAQRMGLPTERERWLTAASEDPGATTALKVGIESFRKMTALEASLQRQLLSMLDQALAEKDIVPDKHAFYLYLKADTHRRLGDLKQAAMEFSELHESAAVPPQMRDFVGYFVTLLEEKPTEKK